MMKTPDEIKRGLEYCNIDVGCFGCTYFDKCADGDSCVPLLADALAYIRQLEADNAQLNRCIENMTDKLNAAHDEVATLQAQAPKWISVEERLPEVDERYDGYEFSEELLVYDGLRRRAAYYCHTSGVWYDSRYEDDTFDVTHWMPLPEQPKEEEE